ncbi:MAG: hypothetical protein AAGF15_04645, partial [Pseudomonadota bacterium]
LPFYIKRLADTVACGGTPATGHAYDRSPAGWGGETGLPTMPEFQAVQKYGAFGGITPSYLTEVGKDAGECAAETEAVCDPASLLGGRCCAMRDDALKCPKGYTIQTTGEESCALGTGVSF